MTPTNRQPQHALTRDPGPSGDARAGRLSVTPTGFEQRLLARARQSGLRANDIIVLGFSGGPDSLALASAMRWVNRRLGTNTVLVHVDHRLRPSSGAEAQRAAALAKNIGLRYEVHRLEAPPQERHRGVGIEEAARRERYRRLFGVARDLGAVAVATGHQLDDQAESVLLHLLRGAGVHGAAAMAAISAAPAWDRDVHDISRESDESRSPFLWRPLLPESRAEIQKYIDFVGLTPLDDPSNLDQLFRRNRLRLEVLPRLTALSPGAAEALARYAALAAEDDALLDKLAKAACNACVHQGGVLDVTCLVTEPLPLQRRMVRRWLESWRGGEAISMDRTEAVLALSHAGEGGKTVEIGQGWSVRLKDGLLHAEWPKPVGATERGDQ